MDKIVITKDGSTTLLSQQFNEHYHSIHGAVAEGFHVFIKNGLFALDKEDVSILEFGFGTGLNALLTLENIGNRKISYCTLEKFPVDEKLFSELNFKSEQTKLSEINHSKLLKAQWDKEITFNNFKLLKKKQDFLTFTTTNKFDLVYFDAFAPNTQPELWSAELFSKIYELLNQNGFLVTYCAKGSVKRTLKSCGFKVIALPGPPGKREMTKAIKP